MFAPFSRPLSGIRRTFRPHVLPVFPANPTPGRRRRVGAIFLHLICRASDTKSPSSVAVPFREKIFNKIGIVFPRQKSHASGGVTARLERGGLSLPGEGTRNRCTMRHRCRRGD
ncbi:hypothetical protein BaRGS_00002198 [Batillaria attramentaria]|uniref:Uncharacterized protein n=1 Tax=Batillaria attramentaria TaxID=370345 RepID=A0ABD0M4R2_9CAEN